MPEAMPAGESCRIGSRFANPMNPTHNAFHVYKRGRLTVVGFDGRQLNDAVLVETCREQLLDLCNEVDCHVLVVDLMEVEIVSSWILGVLAAIHRAGVQVELYHLSPDMRGVLSQTRLDRLLHERHPGVAGDASMTDTVES